MYHTQSLRKKAKLKKELRIFKKNPHVFSDIL